MGDPHERLNLLAADTRAGALANLREDVRARLNAGTPRDLADTLFDLLEAALAKEATVASNTYVSARLSRSSAAEKLDLSVESGTFKNAVKRIEEVLGACRPDDYRLMPPEEDRIGVACIEAMIGGELWLLIVRGPTGEVRGETESPPLLRLTAEFRRLNRYNRTDFHWNLQQSRNFAFTGREGNLQALDAAFSSDVRPQIDILHGLGGVGKSHICVEYAYTLRSRSASVIWWIRATDRTTIDEDLRSLALDLHLAENDTPTAEALTRLRSWLENEKDWVLFFDNADTPDDLLPALPNGGGGRIIVTSLNPAWQKVGRTHEVHDFTEPEAIQFLQNRTGITAEPAFATLSRELGYLPLALEHAAAYIDASALNPEEYLELYRAHQTKLLKRTGSHLSPVAVTWLITIERVRPQSSLAVRILDLSAHFAAAPIPKTLFAVWVDTLQLAPLNLIDAIGALRRYSLINAQARDVIVHRLLQDVVRSNQKKDPFRKYQSTALTLVHYAFAALTFELHSSPLVPRLLPHVYVVTAPKRVATTTTAIHLLVILAMYFDQRGNVDEHIRMLEDASGRCNQETPTRLRLSIWNKLFSSYRFVGNTPGATAALIAAGEVSSRFHPKESGDFESQVEFLTNVAQVLKAVDPEKALPFIEKAMDIVKRMQLEQGMAARAAACYSEVLTDLEEHDEAIMAAEFGVHLDELMFPGNHPARALRLTTLANALEAGGRTLDAEHAYRRALGVRQVAYGEEHIMTAYAHLELARALAAMRRFPEALQECDVVLRHSDALHARVHVDTLRRRATICHDMGRGDAAQVDIERAIAIAEEASLPPSHIQSLRDFRREP